MTFLRLALLALLLAALPSLAPSTAFAQAANETIDTTGNSGTDPAIADRVRSALRQLEPFKRVFVTVNGGVVTLRGVVLELENVSQAEELVGRMDGVVTVNNLLEVETSVSERVTPALERFEKRIGQVMSVLPLAAIGLVIFAIIAAVGILLARLKYPFDAIAPNRFIADLLRQFVRIAFILLGIVLALDIMGATALLGTILGAAGILGLAIGFAVRDTVENYIASILLSFRQPFRPRDLVSISGHEGYVIALTSRATVLMTLDGNHVRIPNATVFKGEITNYSLNPERQFSFKLGVETEDLQRAIELGLEVIGELSFVLPEPAVAGWIEEVGDSSMILWFGAWIDQRNTHLMKARSEAIRRVKIAFEAEGIGLPEPIYRLRFDDGNLPAGLPASSASVAKAPEDKAKEAPQVDTSEQDVSPDREIERKVEEESSRNDGGGLLSKEAPQEVSGSDETEGEPSA